MADAFIKDGSLRVVPTEKAEAILHGALLKYERQVAKFDITDQVEQYRVVLEFEVSLRTQEMILNAKWTQSMTW